MPQGAGRPARDHRLGADTRPSEKLADPGGHYRQDSAQPAVVPAQRNRRGCHGWFARIKPCFAGDRFPIFGREFSSRTRSQGRGPLHPGGSGRHHLNSPRHQ